jgi:ribosomal protein L32
MESITLKHLQKCSKLGEIESNSALKLHFRSEFEALQARASTFLNSQSDQIQIWPTATKKTDPKVTKSDQNGEIECRWCFTNMVPKFQVKRKRIKGDKRLTKTAVFKCKKCHKIVIPSEKLPTLEPLLKRTTKIESEITMVR